MKIPYRFGPWKIAVIINKNLNSVVLPQSNASKGCTRNGKQCRSWSGSALFAQTCLSENLGSLWKQFGESRFMQACLSLGRMLPSTCCACWIIMVTAQSALLGCEWMGGWAREDRAFNVGISNILHDLVAIFDFHLKTEVFFIQIEILDARRTRKGVKQTRLKKPTKEPEPEKPKENDAELLGKYS